MQDWTKYGVSGRLPVSSNQTWPGIVLLTGTSYEAYFTEESNSGDQKSEHLYIQYHWQVLTPRVRSNFPLFHIDTIIEEKGLLFLTKQMWAPELSLIPIFVC